MGHSQSNAHSDYNRLPNETGDSGFDLLQTELNVLRRRSCRQHVALRFVSSLLCILAFVFIATVVIHEPYIAAGRIVVPQEQRIFQEDPFFSGPSNAENDAAWGSLTPKGDGFIQISNRKAHPLPPGIDSPNHPADSGIYDTSLFHQLHCLKEIRGYLWTLKFAVEKNTTAWVLPHLLAPKEPHIGHCFDYIRQSLMCAGDLTLEWPRTEADGRRFAVDGWGVGHSCASWDAISAFVDENAYTGASRRSMNTRALLIL